MTTTPSNRRIPSAAGLLALGLVTLTTLAVAACGDDDTTETTTTDSGVPDSSPAVDSGADSALPTGACAFGEPNETRETAKAVNLGDTITACISTGTEIDFLSFTTPADVTGGFVLLDFNNVGAGNLLVKVQTASDNAEIATKYVTTPGQSVKLWFAAAPGTAYRVAVADFAGFTAEYKYDLKLTYTKVNDTFEPNDKREDAKPLTLGTPVDAYIFAGFKSATIPQSDYDDWYSVTLAAGAVTMKVENVPADVTPEVELYDPSNATVDGRTYSITPGASVTKSSTAATGGTYKVRVNYFSPEPATSGSDVLEHLTKPYKLTITQP
jgi:hypothetical protein